MTTSLYPNLILKTLVYFLIWVLLSESFDLFHLGLGLLAGFGVAWFNFDRTATRVAIAPLRFVGYFLWLLTQILRSGVHLSFLILHPDLPIDPKLVRHRTSLRGEGGIVLLGNSITLTPGTITVELNSRDLVVHAIDDESADDVTSRRMEQKIAAVFGEGGST